MVFLQKKVLIQALLWGDNVFFIVPLHCHQVMYTLEDDYKKPRRHT